MSKEPRYAWIGTFVVGAVCLIVGAVLFFGRGKFFDRTATYISFFSGSVKGLQVGAPVSFRGARVGTVKDVSIVYKPERDELMIPVLLELDADSVRGLNTMGDKRGESGEDKLIGRLIDKGLRARLGLDSIVTGQLFVQLDFYPNVPIKLMADDEEGYEEIPTAPSPLDKIQQTLEDVPFDQLAKKTVAAVEKLDDLLSSPDLQIAVTNLDDLLKELRNVVANIDGRTDGLSKELRAVSSELIRTLESVRGTIGEGSPVVDKTGHVLDEVAGSARAMRRLADYIEQHPEALLRGKQ